MTSRDEFATVAELDDLRHEEPKIAARRCLQALRTARSPVEVGLLLGVRASAFRKLHRLDLATSIVLEEREIGLRVNSRLVQGDSFQRLSYIENYRGNSSAALALSGQAILLHTIGGDSDRVGQSLIDRGLALLLLSKVDMALEANLSGISLLAPRSTRYHYMALGNVAHCYLHKGDLCEAKGYAFRARKIAGEKGALIESKFALLLAEIERRSGDFSAAKTHASLAVHLAEESPIDSAIAAILHVKILMECGEYEATAAALAYARMIGPLAKHSRAAQAAFSFFVTASSRGELSLAVCSNALRKLNDAKNGRHSACRPIVSLG